MDVDDRDEMTQQEHALQFVNSYTSALQSFLLINNTTEWNFGEQLLLHECGLTTENRKIDEKVLNETRIRGIFRRHDARRAIFLHRLLRIQDGMDDTEKRLNLMKKLGEIAERNYTKWVKADELRKEKEEIARQQAIQQQQRKSATEEEKTTQIKSSPSLSTTKKIRVVNPNFQEKREVEPTATTARKCVSDLVPIDTRVDLYDGTSSTTQSVELEVPKATLQSTIDSRSSKSIEIDRELRSPSSVLSSTRPASAVQSLDTNFYQLNDELLLQKKLIGAKRRLESDGSESDSGCTTTAFKKTRLNKKTKKSKTRPRKRAKIDPNAASSFFRDGANRQTLARTRSQRGTRRG